MFTIHIIDTGYIMADGGAMFGAIPKRAWQRKYPANEENLCPLVMRCALAVSNNKVILIDTGMGSKHTAKMAYYRPYGLIGIENALRSLGYASDGITDVVLTHLHFDHCGGATSLDKSGEVTLSFPNATYWLGKDQWENVRKPNRLEADSIFNENILPIHDAGKLQIIDEDFDLGEGFRLRLFDGHSKGQIVVYIDTAKGKYTFPGDLIPTSAHIPLEWISAYDICAQTSLREKERFLSEVVENNYTLIYCHDAMIKESKIKRLNDNFKMA